MSQTLVGVFDRRDDAQAVAQELIGMGIQQTHIRLSDEAAATAATGTSHDKGFWESLKDLFSSDDDDDDRYGLREAARRGSTVLTVTTEEPYVDRVTDVMRRHNVLNLDERARQWGAQGWAGYQRYQATDAGASAAAAAASAGAQHQQQTAGAQKIPVVQEELKVGKRQVNRGGVRVVSRVTERPVEEKVNLREERVHVERRPVDRPVTAADTGAFRERTIEATETAEQAVVAKDARVVEEVVVSKDATQRTETVRDTVRRTDVDVQRTEGDARFRPAYEFADELSSDARYRGRSFDDVEPEIRRSYEQRNPNSRWDDVRDAVRSRFGRTRTTA